MRDYHDFVLLPGSRSTFLKWIQIRQNDTDPTGSGSETLVTLASSLPYDGASIGGVWETELAALPDEPLRHVDARRLLGVRQLRGEGERLQLVLSEFS